MRILWFIIILAFFFQFIDSAAGMGFGTTITPILLLIGYSPLEVVPSLLIVQIISGFTASLGHKQYKNVKMSFSPLNRFTRVTFVAAAIGCTFVLLSIFLAYFAVEFSKFMITLYVSLLVIAVGIMALFEKEKRGEKFKPKRFLGFAAVAGFNKGIGAGGYGPVLTLGLDLAEMEEKPAVGVSIFSESIVTVVGAIAFLSKGTFDLMLFPSLVIGSFTAALLSPYMVRHIPEKKFERLVPFYALAIGGFTLAKLSPLI